jgi:hypothetical protein
MAAIRWAVLPLEDRDDEHPDQEARRVAVRATYEDSAIRTPDGEVPRISAEFEVWVPATITSRPEIEQAAVDRVRAWLPVLAQSLPAAHT